MAKRSYQAEKLALIEEITIAFDGVEREDGVTLHEAEVIDNYGSAAERAEARKKDTETKWQDVPDGDLASCDAALSFLDEKGLRYYIPAYIVWYLKYIDDVESVFSSSNALHSIIFHLTYKRENSERFDIFTDAQKRAIAHFLALEAEREEALEEKWLRQSLYRGGLDKAAVDKTVKEHNLQDNEIRQAIALFWTPMQT